MGRFSLLRIGRLMRLLAPLLMFACTANAQNCDINNDWFLAKHLNNVSDTPVRFAPDIMSTKAIEFNTSMSRDGKAFYFASASSNWSQSFAKVSHFIDGKWSVPKRVEYEGNIDLGSDIHITYNGKQFFKAYGGDIYRSDKQGAHWGKPQKLSSAINTESYESYAITTCSGNLYFQRRIDKVNWDLYVAHFKDGSYQQAQRMPSHINSDIMEADAYIAPDESFMIFIRMRATDGLGLSDLYISYNEKGQWSEPVNMGESVNSKGVDGSPFVSPDRKFLFFTSNRHSKDVEKFDGELDIYVRRIDINQWRK